MVDERDPDVVRDDEIDTAQGLGEAELPEDGLDDVAGGFVDGQAPGVLFHRDGG